MALIDGRAELLSEVADTETDLRRHISAELAQMTRSPLFESGVAGTLLPAAGAQGRRPIIIERIQALIAFGSGR